jgi:hypothetical protein
VLARFGDDAWSKAYDRASIKFGMVPRAERAANFNLF